MARADHQPIEGPVTYGEASAQELSQACGRTVAFVRALDTGTAPLLVQFEDPERERVVCEPAAGEDPVERPLQAYDGRPCVVRALEAALAAHVAGAVVLAAPELADRIQEAIGAFLPASDAQLVRVVAYDAAADRALTRDACEFEVYGLTYGMLRLMAELSEELLPTYERVLVLDSDEVRISAHHLLAVCRDAAEIPAVDIVTSWITWFPHAPYAISRSFIDGLEGSPLVRPRAEGASDRPMPRLRVHDHLFGEEKLAANSCPSPAVERFLEKRTLSAVRAVRLMREARRHPDEELLIPGVATSRTIPPVPAPPNEADRMLLDAAAAAMGPADDASSVDDELVWADAFGSRCRLDFPLLCSRENRDSLSFLDNAATAQRVDRALQAQREYDEGSNANIYRGVYDLSMRSTIAFNDARACVEGFIGAERRTVAFTGNTTQACSLVAQAWGAWHIHAGDSILIGLSEHHSNLVPFLMLAQRVGAQVDYLPYDADGRYDLAAYRSLLAKRPRLVCIAHVGNMFGIEAPVAEMAAAAHEAGARVLVDAAQSFPHIALDVGELGADWVAFSGHKAYGPFGVGGLWIGAEAFAEMDPAVAGGGTVSHVSVDSYYLRTKTIQYELGTPPISQVVGLAAALEYLQELGMGEVRRHEAVLTRYLVEGLHAIDGVTVFGDHSQPDGQVGLVSFTLPAANTTELATFLGQLGVAIRAGGHCALPLHTSLGLGGTARISLGVYTTRDDIDAALAAIRLFARLRS